MTLDGGLSERKTNEGLITLSQKLVRVDEEIRRLETIRASLIETIELLTAEQLELKYDDT